MHFTKMQGAGNDFVLVEASFANRDWPSSAIAMCNRHYGVGADGLVLVLPSDAADIGMRIFNADGSEAETCGNGLRCLAGYALERGLAGADSGKMMVETAAGVRQVRFIKTDGEAIKIQVDMGKPLFGAGEIPLSVKAGDKKLLDITPIFNYPVTLDKLQLIFDFISMGNPHAVYFWQQPVAEFPLEIVGPKVEHHKLFPNRTNFEVARVVDRNRIEARVWERGAGETLACGSGACAIAVAAQLHGYTGDNVDIILPGGVLKVEWDGKGVVLLSGPAEIVFTGEWLEDNNN